MNTVQDVAQYVAQHTAVLPGLLGFSMAARQSLKVRPSARTLSPPLAGADLGVSGPADFRRHAGRRCPTQGL